MSQANISMNDIEQILTGIRIAQSRGAFQLEEAHVLMEPVQRLEQSVRHYKELIKQQETVSEQGDDSPEQEELDLNE